MGFGYADLRDDGDGGGGGGKATSASVVCSICLDVVTDDGDRSWAKLQCDHQFHLDCIGSSFNVKGAMQCPNCRKIEKGQWLYADGGHKLPDFSLDDWVHDEDPYDLSYSEMSFGGHWCPFSGLTRLPSSFDEGEFPSTVYRDLRHHAVFVEHAPAPSTPHPCPYIAYNGVVHPSSSTSRGNIPDSSFSSSYALPSVDAHYHNWDHSSHFPVSSRIGGPDLPPMPSITLRTARNSNIPRTGTDPFAAAHSSVTSSVVSLAHRPPLQAYYQQSPEARASLISSGRRSNNQRSLPLAASSSGRTFQESENPPCDQFRTLECEQRPVGQVGRDLVLAPFHPSAAGSDTGVRPSGFRQRHGLERMPS